MRKQKPCISQVYIRGPLFKFIHKFTYIHIYIYIYITKTKRGIEEGFFGKLSWTVALQAPPSTEYALRELSQVSIVVQAPTVAMLLKQDIQFHNNKSTYQ